MANNHLAQQSHTHAQLLLYGDGVESRNVARSEPSFAMSRSSDTHTIVSVASPQVSESEQEVLSSRRPAVRHSSDNQSHRMGRSQSFVEQQQRQHRQFLVEACGADNETEGMDRHTRDNDPTNVEEGDFDEKRRINDDSFDRDCAEDEGCIEIPPAKYVPEQRVFSRDGDSLYESIIRRVALKTTTKTKQQQQQQITKGQQTTHHYYWAYFVHYLGWNSRWDKWIAEEDLRPDTCEIRTLAEQTKELARALERTKKEKVRQMELAKKQRRATKSKEHYHHHYKRRRLDEHDDLDQDDGESRVCTMKEWCTLPFTLKTVLGDDRERITRKNGRASGYDASISDNYWAIPRAVHVIPATITVWLILHQFMKVVKKKKETNRVDEEEELKDDNAVSTGASPHSTTTAQLLDATSEANESDDREKKLETFVQGMSTLFDTMLPKFLLYPQERAQYLNLIHDDAASAERRPCDLYGGEFLLRMLVRLPTMLVVAVSSSPRAIICPSDLQEMGRNVSELIVFLQKNRSSCFKGNYRHPNEEEWTALERSLIRQPQQPQPQPSKTTISTNLS